MSLFKTNPDEFLRGFLTVDEIWSHHNTLETKHLSISKFLQENHTEEGQGGIVSQQSQSDSFQECTQYSQMRLSSKRKKIIGEYYANALERFNDDSSGIPSHLIHEKMSRSFDEI